jgi:hypothetical protein
LLSPDTEIVRGQDAESFGVQLWIDNEWRWVDQLGSGGFLAAQSPRFSPEVGVSSHEVWRRLVNVLAENGDSPMAVSTLGDMEFLHGPGTMGPFRVVYFE